MHIELTPRVAGYSARVMRCVSVGKVPEALAKACATLAALQDRQACLLGQHGQIALGRTFDAALSMATEVETLARMYVHACTLGEPPVLSDAEMERVIAQMRRMSYGLGPEPEGSTDIARPRARQKALT